jgi:hypothetical protein
VGKEFAEIGLVAVAGILIGGVYSTWKNNSKVTAAVLGVAALLALGGAIAWLVS